MNHQKQAWQDSPKLTISVHKTEGVNRTQTVRFYPFVFTGNGPRKGKRIPLNIIRYNEQRNEETGYGYLPRQARQAHHGARYYWQMV